jgi:hypothetical protein
MIVRIVLVLDHLETIKLGAVRLPDPRVIMFR